MRRIMVVTASRAPCILNPLLGLDVVTLQALISPLLHPLDFRRNGAVQSRHGSGTGHGWFLANYFANRPSGSMRLCDGLG
jgi:hypothetical protein